MASAVSVLVILLIASAMVQAEIVNSYWQRMAEGFPNPTLVHEYVYEYRGPELEITARIPQLAGVADSLWEADFNQNLRDRLDAYVTELKESAQEAWSLGAESEYRPFPYEGIVDFEVKLNQGGLLSIAVLNYTYTGGAHGMTYYDYINVDLTSGHPIGFGELFNTDAELERAAGVIDARIKEEQDHFFIDTFAQDQFNEDQGFYLKDTQVVICFGLYDLAPYAYGIQEFAISAP
jgi:hypothetical protein